MLICQTINIPKIQYLTINDYLTKMYYIENKIAQNQLFFKIKETHICIIYLFDDLPTLTTYFIHFFGN